jgi:hypothetical protein
MLTNSSSITLVLFILLAVFVSVAWIINKIIKRSVVNGALFFLFVGGIFLAVHLINAINSTDVPASLGGVIGTFLLPALLGFYLTRRFEKNKNIPKSIAAPPEPFKKALLYKNLAALAATAIAVALISTLLLRKSFGEEVNAYWFIESVIKIFGAAVLGTAIPTGIYWLANKKPMPGLFIVPWILLSLVGLGYLYVALIASS